MPDKELLEAAENILHLHLSEMEGMSSGKPTRVQWLEAVDKLSAAIENCKKVKDPPKFEWVEKFFGTYAYAKIGGWGFEVFESISGNVFSHRAFYLADQKWLGVGLPDMESAKAACEQKFRELWVGKHSKK